MQNEILLETCCNSNCGIVFGMTEGLKQARLKDGADFYCPRGHAQHYINSEKSKTVKLQKEVGRLARLVTFERRNKERVERQLSATQGVVTKLKKKIKK